MFGYEHRETADSDGKTFRLIGTTPYHLVDKSRREAHSQNVSDNRELVAQIWYPAELEASCNKGLVY